MENSWKNYRFSDVIDLIGGGTPKTSESSYWNGDIPWLSVVDFNTGRKYVSDTEKKITEEGLNNSSTKLLNEGDIIISARGTVGALAVLDKTMAFNQSCYGVRAKEDFSFNDYIFYLLKDTVNNLKQFAHGGVFDTITKDTFKEIEIQLPPLPEQKAIASVLSSLDDKIDLLHQQNQTLEALAETLFRQWFIEEAKEDWEDCTIEDLAIHSKISVHPNRNPDTLYHHYSIPAFDANKKPVVELGKEIQSNKYKVEENSILFSKLNPHKDKRVWLIQDNVEEHAICSTELQVVKPKDEDYLYFIYGWLTNSIYYNEIASGVGGTSGSHQRIESKAIFSAPCVKIKKNIILQYNIHAKPLFKKQFENQQQIQTLTQLRDTLLPKLMSGEVRVKL